MNYTTNYRLPQWAETDRIQMEDFNQAMADIDQGLSDAYRPSNLPYFIGSYTGNGDTLERTIKDTAKRILQTDYAVRGYEPPKQEKKKSRSITM